MKVNHSLILREAFALLDETGLSGLTVRALAGRLNVQPGTLYWHFKSKQDLLDAMASEIFAGATEGLEAPRAGTGWQNWLADFARSLRRAMLRHRDGGKLFAGSNLREPAVYRATELTLRTLEDAGFSIGSAARSVAALLHYTVGFTIEEQEHIYAAEDGGAKDVGGGFNASLFPLTLQAYASDNLLTEDADECFEYALAVIINGMQATHAAVRG
jgi:TetR/AcrR family tetracycline transcriptional repressor